MCGRFTQFYTWVEAREFLDVFGPARNLMLRLAAFSMVLVCTLLNATTLLALDPGQTETISARDVYVTDGDTIRVHGETYRLVEFDASEIGSTARCEREVEQGYAAKARVVDLVHEAKHLTLERVACSCAHDGLEGTKFCNYGRRCGTLRADGIDIGTILIRERLRKPYPYCARTSHPETGVVRVK